MAQNSRHARLKKKVEVGWSFLTVNLLLAGILVLAYRLRGLPVIALIAFIPVFFRGLVWFVQEPQLIAVRRLGWTELAHALVFGALLTAGFGLIRSSEEEFSPQVQSAPDAAT
jgi:hypothetical protein